MREKRTWNTINVSWHTYENLRKLREKGDSMNAVIRGLMNLEVPDPTRPTPSRRAYYDEDWI